MTGTLRFLCLSAGAVAAAAILHTSLAQDPVRSAPGVYKVLLDNDRVRVLDVHLKPGQTSPTHSHPEYLVYCVTGGKVKFTGPDGRSENVDLKAGECTWRPAETHSVDNVGTTECHVLNIEFKEGGSDSRGSRGETPAAQPLVVNAADVKWMDAPGLPPGAKQAIISGDPSQPGPFTLRLKFPAGSKVSPHTHPSDEHVTIISGTSTFGLGDNAATAKTHKIKAGTFLIVPKGAPHFVHFDEETVMQLQAHGPWGITYTNPADDPRKSGAGH